MLAAKTSLCVRVDALGEESDLSIGVASRAKVEERLRQCEQGQVRKGGREGERVGGRKWVEKGEGGRLYCAW